jgi:Tc5 transposase DNA-binding domain
LDGTVDTIIQSTVSEFGSSPKSIKKMINSRVKRNNLMGVPHQKVSPIKEIEPLLVEWCVKMARIGHALTRQDVMKLASELIEGTKFADELVKFKENRNIQTSNKYERAQLKNGWYRGFMKRNGDQLKRRKCVR